MDKKLVVHLISSLGNGGCENMLLRTLPLMSEFEHTVVVLKTRGELAPKFEKAGIKVLGFNNIFKLKPDLILTYLFHADVIGRLFLPLFFKIKIVPFLRTTYNHPKYMVARIFEKLTKNLVLNYLANSQSVVNFYSDNYKINKNKFTVIPNGINVKFYDGIKPVDHKIKTIICVANLHINKGHKYLLEAFEQVYKINNNIKLVLVGDGVEKDNLQSQVSNYRSKNKVEFLGNRHDVPRLLKQSDIFVLPTLFEGMSNALMEAMVCNLPIITTDIPENKTILDTDSALLVPVENSQMIAKNIKLLLSDSKLATKLGKNARQKIVDNYDLIKVAKQYEGFIRKYISK